MIPAHPGYIAVFGSTDSDGKFLLQDQLPVEAWDDDGCPLVIPSGRPKDRYRGLTRADRFDNFASVQRDDGYPEIVALIPGGGWRIEWSDEGHPPWSQPLVGWGITTTGSVVPLDTDGDGLVEPIDPGGKSHRGVRIFHPDPNNPDPDVHPRGTTAFDASRTDRRD